MIVAPVTVMANWAFQIGKHINKKGYKNTLVVSQYHGPRRESKLSLVQLNQVDILITSYHTLVSDLKKHEDGKGKKENLVLKNSSKKMKSSLTIFDLTFHRVVLDEAHIIRNSKTGFFKVARSLRTNHKLCLTGTIFVNRPDDIHSILSFLELKPLNDKAAFDKAVTKRIEARDPVGLCTLRTTLASVALRRTKAQVLSTIKLVSKEIVDKKIEFPQGEQKRIHDTLYIAARMTFLSFLKSGAQSDAMDNYMAFLEIVLRVRQGKNQNWCNLHVCTLILIIKAACCHAGLVPPERLENSESVKGTRSTLNEPSTDSL